ncbi:hypothetical protein WME98_23620 [Sorangium sp. So ce296]
MPERLAALEDVVVERGGALEGRDLLDVADPLPDAHLAEGAEAVALGEPRPDERRAGAVPGAKEAFVIGHRVEDALDRGVDVDVDVDLCHAATIAWIPRSKHAGRGGGRGARGEERELAGRWIRP